MARVFYRAGYIEKWGRGIQKIRDACKVHDAEEPEYIVSGGDIMVKFKALQSGKPPSWRFGWRFGNHNYLKGD
ncbi:MAG: hypothetical protein GX939_08565 [Clostridiaceae bacterium]|nr:hypothetical protein [Clostridiaceae bacterium]